MSISGGGVAVVSAARTAIGTLGGSLKNMPAPELGATVIREVLRRAAVEPGSVDEVIMGQVYQAGVGPNGARVAAIKAGIPNSVPSFTVNKVCGSGMKSIALGAQTIQLGQAHTVVCGGMESMSQVPYLLPQARWGNKLGHSELVDGLLKDGLWDCFYDCHMGSTAENLAQEYGIPRGEQDRFAAQSQERALAAIDMNRFKDEICSVFVPQQKGPAIEFNHDEHPRQGVSVESLYHLRPAFEKDGTVTAGNASGINDGAAAVVLMTEAEAKRRELAPLAYVKSCAIVGVDPRIMGIAPAFAVRKLVAQTKTDTSLVGLFEINEAFAAQTLAVVKELELDEAKVNVNGGAIALGHPLAASGARISVTLLYEMKRRNIQHGIASLCIGGGMGIAMLFERER